MPSCPCSGGVGANCTCHTTRTYSNYVGTGAGTMDPGYGSGGMMGGGGGGGGVSYSKTTTTQSRSGGDYGGGMSYGGSGGTNGNLHATTMSEKAQLGGLNDRLAGFMQKIREMCQSGASAVDPAKYHEMMRILEQEIGKLRNMYEDEINRLRRQLQDALNQVAQLANAANSCKGNLGDINQKLQIEINRANQAEQALNNLHRQLADKDKLIADLEACIKGLRMELDHLRPNGSMLTRDNEDLRRQLEQERKARLEAEARAKALEDKVRFDGQVSNEQQKDLADRIRTANEIIQVLESKLKQLANDKEGNLPSLLQRLRDGTVADMRQFQRETEEALNSNLAGLKKQADNEAALRDKLMREKGSLADQLRQMEARCNALKGELEGLKNDNNALRRALDNERAQCNATIRDLENQLRECKGTVISKVKEYNNARDAQASVQNEINNYRGLLDIGKDTMKNCPMNPDNQISRSAANMSSSPANICTTANYHEYSNQSQSARPDPPSYQTAMQKKTYAPPSGYSVQRVSTTYQAPPACPTGPDCRMGVGSLPSIGSMRNPYNTTYGSAYSRKFIRNPYGTYTRKVSF